jgi:two-component system nitrate/nitrite response regulator NarL
MTSGGGGGILVIEPEDETRTMISALLRSVGYLAREDASGRSAIAAARRERPDLVLLEVDLRDMTGYELCRQLRDTYGEGLPIIFIAGTRVDTADRIAGLLIGADDYVTKPFAPDELVARVRRAINRSASVANGGRQPRSTYGLTARELEVLRLLAAGLTQRDISRELFISPDTVGTHIQRMLTKLGVHSRAEAVALAYREGLVAVEATVSGLDSTASTRR